MEPKRSYRAFREEVSEESTTSMEIGKAQVVQEGTDITVISWGAMMRHHTCRPWQEVSKERGTSAWS